MVHVPAPAIFLLTTFRGRGHEEPRGVEFKLLPQKGVTGVLDQLPGGLDPGGWKAVLQNTWGGRPSTCSARVLLFFLLVQGLFKPPSPVGRARVETKLSHAQL